MRLAIAVFGLTMFAVSAFANSELRMGRILSFKRVAIVNVPAAYSRTFAPDLAFTFKTLMVKGAEIRADDTGEVIWTDVLMPPDDFQPWNEASELRDWNERAELLSRLLRWRDGDKPVKTYWNNLVVSVKKADIRFVFYESNSGVNGWIEFPILKEYTIDSHPIGLKVEDKLTFGRTDW